MTPQELKNSILQLAIQGKLVEQRPEEGTAAELLGKIARYGTTGTHGTTKTTGTHGTKSRAAHRASPVSSVSSVSSVPVVPSVPDDEKPFDIPESWEWVRLGDVASIERGSGIKRSETSSSGFPCVRYGEIYTTYGYSFTSTKSFVTETVASSCHKANHGDVLCTLTGEWKEEIAKATAYLGKAPIAVGGDLAKISSHVFNPVLLVYFFFAPFMIQQKASKANGTMIVHIGKEAVSNLLIPLPPLAEQKRIVAKIEELLPLIDRYEKAWSKLEDFNRRFPVDMQKSVLQMAIQGKLVDQRPEEGTGEELYRQIQAEKQRLVKSGKIKKEKSLPEITEDEIPFEIPDSWMWTRLGEISWFFDAGKSPSCLKQPVKDKEWGVITTTSIQIGFFDETQNKVLPNGFSVNKSMQVRPKDILITRAGPMSRTGVACLVRAIRHNLILSDKTVRINMTDNNVYKNYIVKVLNSPQIRQFIINLMSGMDKQQVNISQEKFKTVLIPLPPLAEQERIVAKLEEILPLCERLK